MDNRVFVAAIIAAVLLGVLALMAVAWRKRVRRDGEIGTGFPVPVPLPTPLVSTNVLYVATSKAGEPIERLALPGLAYRSKVGLQLSADGIAIEVPGDQTTFIPAAAITEVGQSNLTIDRVVERDGLIVVTWNPAPQIAADSYFRVLDQSDRARIIDTITGLIPAGPAPANEPREHNESAS